MRSLQHESSTCTHRCTFAQSGKEKPLFACSERSFCYRVVVSCVFLSTKGNSERQEVVDAKSDVVQGEQGEEISMCRRRLRIYCRCCCF